MSCLNKYIFIIPLVLLIACSAGNNNGTVKPNVSNNFNYNSLVTPNGNISNPPPSESICYAAYQEESLLIPPEAECGLQPNATQIANGCTAIWEQSDSLNSVIAHSVVGIAIPKNIDFTHHTADYWKLSCSGTIIDKQWILTAAHCFANDTTDNRIYNTRGFFSEDFKSVSPYIITLSKNESIVPSKIYADTPNKYIVQTIYIPYHFNYYMQPFTPPYPYFVKDDIALLKLESPLPDIYKPISIESDLLPTAGSRIWSAGYGFNESQDYTERLNYRNIYFMSDKYYSQWYGGTTGNYGEFYTLGSLPTLVKGKTAAWSFEGPGDSGGPILEYDDYHNSFSLVGEHTAGLNCDYAGFYAPLPYPYSVNVSIPVYYDFISSVINQTTAESAIRCISPFPGGCNRKNSIFVVNKNSNSISIYETNQDNGTLIWKKNITTGIAPSSIALSTNEKFLYTTNITTNSISQFMLQTISSTPLPTSPPQISSYGNLPVKIRFNQKSAYVVNQLDNRISVYKLNLNNGSLIWQSNIETGNSPEDIEFGKIHGQNYAYVVNYLDNTISTYKVTASGSLTEPASYPSIATGTGPVDLKVNPITKLVYVTNYLAKSISVYSISPTDGHLENKWEISLTYQPDKILFDRLNTHMFILGTNNKIYTYKLSPDDLLEYVSEVDTGKQPATIALDLMGRYLYVVNSADNNIYTYKVDKESSSLTFENLSDTGEDPTDIAIEYIPL